MHIFPYSVRSGTAAARWKQLPPEVLRERVNRLIELDFALSLAYRSKLIGRTVQVILEQSDSDSGLLRGRCEYYAEISVPSKEQIGSIVETKVTQVMGAKTVAVPALQIL